ncbi:hypothetical protein M407DRAFT_191138 [Tulasnella calospora MUT 4182]|uniref:Uncharacterized protein n=1 Tax=Tulasnella calospora MUT 4182 TaxID=1051891 RepID=A0A0C3QAR5_9AGAM|nr:hypothetical protein M407DRAFT_191138 [Tulasnella calospora MUT 4182]
MILYQCFALRHLPTLRVFRCVRDQPPSSKTAAGTGTGFPSNVVVIPTDDLAVISASFQHN